ncbi:hypothetical protein C7T94_03900 [Pedobacter yulinensis]|uniref:Membrane fusion protein biotin-lipoyl like domain-containing protein n=1 Tax=Pedobacter yulinensis TaxID=2126353 RepID=A0A2T3HN93_9SPHI|nr:HlyD family efflux transporter periplasmic adaptor subunit [Pedobacter yulinensis]PST83899.1 hypothetical protein C7T94_03900 [Pedobacter yulinensis]
MKIIEAFTEQDIAPRTGKSRESQEFIRHKPSSVEKYAIQVIAVIFVLILTFTYFFEYADTVTQQTHLTAESAPQKVRAGTPGRIKEILVADRALVSKGQVIAWLDSDLDYSELNALLAQLNKTEELLLHDESDLKATAYLRIINKFGEQELQQAFSQFLNSALKYEAFNNNGYYRKRLSYLRSQAAHSTQQHNKIDLKTSLAIEDYNNSKMQFDQDSLLYKQQLVTITDLAREKSQLISKKNGIYDLNISRLNARSNYEDHLNSIDELQHQRNEAKLATLENLESLKNVLVKWMNNHTIKAPGDGVYEPMPNVQTSQYMEGGQTVGYILPEKAPYYFISYLSQSALSKVTIGDRVDIRLVSYPYKEFGHLSGKVASISKVALDSGYACKIKLQNSLSTNTNKKIPYRENLVGEAVFTTKETTLFKKLTQGFLKTEK